MPLKTGSLVGRRTANGLLSRQTAAEVLRAGRGLPTGNVWPGYDIWQTALMRELAFMIWSRGSTTGLRSSENGLYGSMTVGGYSSLIMERFSLWTASPKKITKSFLLLRGT